MLIAEQSTEPGLVAEWKLDTAQWLDTVGTNHLLAVGTGPDLGFDGTNYYAEFNGSRNTDYLQCSGVDLDTRTNTANWSWRLKFDVWMRESFDQYFQLGNQFVIYLNETSLELELYSDFDYIAGGGAQLFNNVWHTVELRYHADTNTIDAYRDGVLAASSSLTTTAPEYRAVGNFRVGFDVGVGTRIKNVKFYKTALIPRS